MNADVKMRYSLLDLVEKTRKQMDIPKKNLYNGIDIAKKISGTGECMQLLDHLSWDYLLGRLGISDQVYEGYVYAYEVELYEVHLDLRATVNRLIYMVYERKMEQHPFDPETFKTQLQSLEIFIQKYQKLLNSRQAQGSTSKRFHTFFLKKMKGYLLMGQAFLDGGTAVEACRTCIQNAWNDFHEGNCFDEKQRSLDKQYLSPMELECLLQAAMLLEYEGQFSEAEQLLGEVWDYRNHHEQDLAQQAKIYPYVAFLLEVCDKKLGKSDDKSVLREAKELLVQAGKLSGMMPLLELMQPNFKEEFDALHLVSAFSHVDLYGIYPLCSIENASLVSEVIRYKRKSVGKKQSQVCDGVLSEEWYSKFENGHFMPRWNNTSIFLMEFGFPYQRQWLKLDTDRAEAFRLQQMCYRNLNEFQYELMDYHYAALKSMLNMDSVVNAQFFCYMDCAVNQEIMNTLSREERHQHTFMIIQKSIPEFPDVEYKHMILSDVERRLLNQYACSIGDKYQTRDLLYEIVQAYNNNSVRASYPDQYEMILISNYLIHLGITEHLVEAIRPKRQYIATLLRQASLHGLSHGVFGWLTNICDAYPKSKTVRQIYDRFYNASLHIAEMEHSKFMIEYIRSLEGELLQSNV